MRNISFTFILILLVGCASIKVDSYSYVDKNDIHIFYHKGSQIKYYEQGEGETLLFIHGLGASSYTWRYLSQYYKENYRVICIDLEGFGESSKPKNKKYELNTQSTLVKSFIKRKKLTNVTLIGNSFGGTVALQTYLTGDRSKISKIILLDSTAYPQKYPSYISLLKVPIINRLAFYVVPHQELVKWVLNEICFNKSLITKEMIATYSSYMLGVGSHNALISSTLSITSKDVMKLSTQYKEVEVPVLIIWGENDTITDISIGRRLNRDIKNSVFKVIKNCGHIPQEEEPAKTIAIMDEFLNTQKAIY